jgi:hypothetical protein
MHAELVGTASVIHENVMFTIPYKLFPMLSCDSYHHNQIPWSRGTGETYQMASINCDNNFYCLYIV